MLSEGKKSWGELHGNPGDFEEFSSRPFLDGVLPKLEFGVQNPTVLEYGTGTGPVACYLSERGFQVEAGDLIPSAIEVAKKLAEDRGLKIDFKVLDICELSHKGRLYDLIVDTYCLQGIVTDEDRKKVFSAIKSRLKSTGYYLISTAMYVRKRDFQNEVMIDTSNSKKYNLYGPGGIFDPVTEIFYEPFSEDPELEDKPEDYDNIFVMNDERYLPRRRYRKPESLKNELESKDFASFIKVVKKGKILFVLYRNNDY